MKATDSPALANKSAYYPHRFDGKVPKRVRMNEKVESEVFQFTGNPLDYLVAHQGVEYDVWVNRNGAVSAILPSGQLLGLKPEEFEVTEWH